MKLPQWDVEVDGVSHKVELRHSFWMALLIYVDGTLVHRARGFPLSAVGDFPFLIGSHEALLRVRDLHTFVDYSLTVDGQLVEDNRKR
jgi:hypothetical protein